MESENTTITRDKTKYLAAIVIILVILMSVAAFFLPDESVSMGIPVSIISPDFIERVGFPVATTIMVLYTVVWMIRKDEKRQQKGDERYTALVNEFISTMKSMSKDNQSVLAQMAQQLQETTLTINAGIAQTQEKIADVRYEINRISSENKGEKKK